MTQTTQYAIQGGVEGRERLRILGNVMRPHTIALFERIGVRDGDRCLDAGCGGGDATLDLAGRVAPRGAVLGIDVDDVKVQLARAEAAARGVRNVEFRCADVHSLAAADTAFDAIYARFLLSHLGDPGVMLDTFYRHLRPGGVAAVVDVDFTGHTTYPSSRAFERYNELYIATVSRRGGDPNIGLHLPVLLADAGFDAIEVAIVQPMAIEGEAKLLNPLTMRNLAQAVLADALASPDEIDRVVEELYAFARDPRTVAGLPRIVQAWGRRPMTPAS